jgi:flagellar biosynthesis/type III secretory pathway M-ring protein FliF/YscJ
MKQKQEQKTMVEHKPDKIVLLSIGILAILCIFVVLFIF